MAADPESKNSKNLQHKSLKPDVTLIIYDGMLVVMGDVVHAGADAMHVMAACSTSSGWFNRCNRWIFSSRRLSRLMYPILRAGRRLALLLLGVPLIRKAHH